MSEYNVTRNEKLLSSVASGNPSGIDPITREEMFLSYIAGESDKKPKPITRKEKLLDKIGASGDGGGAKPEQEKTVEITENGTTDVLPDAGYALSKVTVNANVAVGGEPGKPYLDTSKLTNFDSFCRQSRIPFEYLDHIDTSNGTAFGSMFESYDFQHITDRTHPPINTSKGRYFQYMYRHCSKIETIPHFDTANGENFTATFFSCGAKNISITTAKKDLTTDTFQNCSSLVNLTIGEGWAVSIYLNYSNNLTVESLHGMIENLADLTGKTAKNFNVGATNLAKIDEDHMAMLNAKNWNYS